MTSGIYHYIVSTNETRDGFIQDIICEEYVNLKDEYNFIARLNDATGDKIPLGGEFTGEDYRGTDN